MRIGVAGPGALGGLLATVLARGGEDRVLLIDHRPERAKLIDRQGLTCVQGSGEEHFALSCSAEPGQLGPVDVLLCCVKSPDLAEALAFCRPLLDPETLLVLTQNGIAHLRTAEELPLAAPPAFLSTTEGATLLAPGRVRHAGRGESVLGFLEPVAEALSQRLADFTERLVQGGLSARVVEDIRDRLWAKLMVNAGINGLTALYNRSNGQLLTSCAARSRLKQIVAEAAEVARASGVTLHQDPIKATLKVCAKTAGNVSSMLQDVRHKRRTEIMAINGALVSEGRRLGIPTPHNQRLVEQVQKLEQSYA